MLTIGGLRLQGVVALQVRCQRPCKRVGRVALDDLQLPDETIVHQIPTLRRLRCEACDRCLPDLQPIWPQRPTEPVGFADSQATHWVVVMTDAVGRQSMSSPLWSGSHAARFAKEQVKQGYSVTRIETPTGIVEADEIAAWCAAAEQP